MTTPMSLPAIKITKTRSLEPVTPSDVGIESPTPPPITESNRPSTGGQKDSSKVSSNNGSPIIGDTEKPSSLTRTATGGTGRRGTIQQEDTADPVPSAILHRTGAENVIPRTFRHDRNEDSGGVTNGRMPDNTRNGLQLQGRGKKKGVSFLSRIMGTKKKVTEESDETESVDGGNRRTEGMDAAVFSQPIGFTPTFPAPPKYIRVHAHQKPQRDFNQMFLAQELYTHVPASDDGRAHLSASESTLSLDLPKNKSGAIFAMKFSNDGRYLATAGQDKVVRVWQVLGSKEDRSAHEQGEDAAGIANSMDAGGDCGEQGIRLNAPVFMSEPIHEYHGHTGDILALSWSKNNFLLSSSMDSTVRLWHVTRNECLCCFQHSDFVTSIAFHPRDDRFFLAGSLDSKLRLWSIPDKSVAFWNELPDLITAVAFTPDGRMAIAGCLNGLCLFYETEGLRYHTQLHARSSHGRNAKGSKITGIETATFPPDDPNGEVKILITSNDSRVRMYNARDKGLETKFKGYKNTCSQIHATFSDDARYIISGSEDRRVYIWNVGPVDADKKDKRPVEFFEAHPAIITVALMAPVETRQVLGRSGDPLYDLCNPPPITLVSRSNSITSKRTPTAPPSTVGDDLHPSNGETRNHMNPAENPSWAARSTHPDGNIIVTADYTGRIKIFRQDCAAAKRRNESWDTVAILSKRIGTGILRKGSLNRGSPDRIISWRQSIASIHSLEAGSIRSRTSVTTDNTSLRHRSASPRKPINPSNVSVTSTSSPKFGRGIGGSLRSKAQSLSQAGNRPRNGSIGKNSVRSEGALRQDLESPLIREMSHATILRSPESGKGKPGRSGVSSDEEDGGIFSSDAESDGEAVRCKKCGSTSFKAKHNRRGEHRLVCVKCNTAM